MQKQPFLQGKYVFLRPLTLKDISDRYLSWLNDPQVNRFNSHAIFPYTKSELISYVKSAGRDRDKVILAIIDKKIDRHIGNIALQNIDWVARSAEFAILIGDRNYWGKGIGEEAGKLIVEYGFVRLNLHRISCGTSAENVGMQKLALILNMREEGRRKEAMFKNGKYVDILEYGLTNQ